MASYGILSHSINRNQRGQQPDGRRHRRRRRCRRRVGEVRKNAVLRQKTA